MWKNFWNVFFGSNRKKRSSCPTSHKEVGQFYSPTASSIAHNCIVYAVIFVLWRVVFARSLCERCELLGRIKYHWSRKASISRSRTRSYHSDEVGISLLLSLPICVIMELTKSLALWVAKRREGNEWLAGGKSGPERDRAAARRWRRSRRRGRTIPLSPAIAGALPKGEPLDALVHL